MRLGAASQFRSPVDRRRISVNTPHAPMWERAVIVVRDNLSGSCPMLLAQPNRLHGEWQGVLSKLPGGDPEGSP